MLCTHARICSSSQRLVLEPKLLVCGEVTRVHVKVPVEEIVVETKIGVCKAFESHKEMLIISCVAGVHVKVMCSRMIIGTQIIVTSLQKLSIEPESLIRGVQALKKPQIFSHRCIGVV